MTNYAIPAAEFRERQQKARLASEKQGFPALVVWSRFRSSDFYHADVSYLANQHSIFPPIPDSEFWSGRSYSALILPVDGDPILLVDQPTWDPAVAVDDVRFAPLLPETVADVLKEKNLAGETVGLVARDTMLVSTLKRIEERLGGPLNYKPADDILDELKAIKSEAELDCLRQTAAAGVEFMSTMMRAAEPGMTQAEVVAEGLHVFAAKGGYLKGMGINSGTDLEFFRYGAPPYDAKKVLNEGDLLHIDLWATLQDNYYMVDFARSTVVGGQPSDEQLVLLDGAVELIAHLIDGIKPGVVVDDLVTRGTVWMNENGLGTPQDGNLADLFPESFGHGYGMGMDRPWLSSGDKTELKEGMVLSIEYFLTKPGVGAANFEDDIIVTADGAENITSRCPARPWQE